jgi:LysM repeat protein
MSRRDTIIVAVLINTGLLAVLFMMAIQTDNSREFSPIALQQEIAEADVDFLPERKFEERKAVRDELDEVIQNYSVNSPVTNDTVIEEVQQEIVKLPKKQETKTVDVTVKRGDSLDKIARSNRTTIEEIKKASGLVSDRLSIGQVLKVPVSNKKGNKTGISKKEEKKPQEIALQDGRYYTMKSGDNPWKIAMRFHIGTEDLLKMNHLDEEKARGLKPGDVLRVK